MPDDRRTGDLDAIFKAYDIRGVYPDQIDESVAQRVGTARPTLTTAVTTGA